MLNKVFAFKITTCQGTYTQCVRVNSPIREWVNIFEHSKIYDKCFIDWYNVFTKGKN